MNWKSEFSPTILSRGLSYYREGRVLSLQTSAAIRTAFVKGHDRKTYYVEIHVSKGEVESVTCTCPYARDGHLCKHMAAVLFASDAADLKKGDGQKSPSGDARLTASLGRSLASAFAPAPVKATDAPSGGSSSASSPAKAAGGFVPNPIVHPFAVQNEDTPAARGYRETYRYFDLEAATKSYTFHRADVERAEKLLADKAFSRITVNFGYADARGGHELIGRVQGEIGSGYPPQRASIDFTKNKLTMHTCYAEDCPIHKKAFLYARTITQKETLCPYETALLLYARDYLLQHPVGDSTDLGGRRLLNALGGRLSSERRDANAREGAPVTLSPRLHEDGEWLRVDFRVGTEKLYVVKDLRALVKAVEDREEYPLGKNSALNFASHRFTPESAEWFHFLSAELKEQELQYKTASASYETLPGQGGGRSSLALFGRRLDVFYSLAENKTMPIVSNFRFNFTKAEVEGRDGQLVMDLQIAPKTGKRGSFEGITVSGTIPQLYQGVDSFYYLEAESDRRIFLNRISRENAEALSPFLSTADYDGAFAFTIGRRHLADFYYHVLPAIEPYVRVDETDTDLIAPYLPPRMRLIFYLDAPDSDITCLVRAAYDDELFDLAPQGSGARETSYRDGEAEEEALAYVQTLFPEYDPTEGLFRTERTNDAVYSILETGVDELLKRGEVMQTDRFRSLRIRRSLPFKVGISIESDLMTVSVLSDDISPEELLEILKSYRRKKRYYRLRNGDFIDLTSQSAAALERLFDAAHVSPREFVRGKMKIPAYRALYLNKMLEEHEDITASRDEVFRKLIRSFRDIKDTDITPPASLAPLLRPYQAEGFKWMMTVLKGHFGGILADDMGLGKTLQMLSVLLYEKEHADHHLTSLIVCPASLVYNWCEEVARFVPSLSIAPVAGKKEERDAVRAGMGETDILVTSYDSLKRDIDAYEGLHFHIVVLDEAQYIKNPASAAAKSVKVLSASHRFALTGTPIENRLSELWSIFDFLMPGFLYGYETFRKELESPIMQREDEAAAARLKGMTAPFILRRVKKDVLRDLPDKLEETRYAAFEEDQRVVYDAQVTQLRAMLGSTSEEALKTQKIQVLAGLTRLRQICCDPSLLLENYGGSSAKREALRELVAGAIEGGHRMLIFSQFTSMLSLIEQDLSADGIRCYKLTGETPARDRIELVRSFNKGSVPVFLISLKAGGTGLNLTGADFVIHYDPWWNLAVENQATDRTYRIGQTKDVSVFRLIARGTIEEKILQLQEKKKSLSDELLGGETGTLGSLSRDDLLELLS